jgi:hypothetical protein
MGLQEGSFVSGQLLALAQPGAGDPGLGWLGRAAWPLPFEEDTALGKPVDSVGELRQPRSATQLSIRDDIETQIPLPAKDVEDGLIFGGRRRLPTCSAR